MMDKITREQFLKEVNNFSSETSDETLELAEKYDGRIEDDFPLVVRADSGKWCLITESIYLNWLALGAVSHMQPMHDTQKARVYSFIAHALTATNPSEKKPKLDTEISVNDALDELINRWFSGGDLVTNTFFEGSVEDLRESCDGHASAIDCNVTYYRRDYQGKPEKVNLTLANMLYDRQQGL